MSELLDEAAIVLAARVRRREVSPLELVDVHVARIEEVNPFINALAANRFERARAEARAAGDALVKRSSDDPLPPLYGVPCTIKEFLAVKGMPLSAGIYSRRDVRATVDADVVRRLRGAGAIILGVTNIPEGGLWMETSNQVYGRTNNPWNVRHTPGGSTGGEAALIATGGSPFGMGADVGGSIRIPSAFCGTVGHKPTGRLVSNQGYWPPVTGELDSFLCVGPMTRRVDDLWPLLQIIANTNSSFTDSKNLPVENNKLLDWKKVVVYPLETNGRIKIAPVMQDCVRRAAEAMRLRGARVAELRTRGFERAFEIWGAMLASVPGQSYAKILGDGKTMWPLVEIAKAAFGRSRFTLPALIIAAGEQLLKLVPGEINRFVEAGRTLQAHLEAELGENGILLHPPYSRPAPRHNGPLLTPFDFVCTGIFNVMEFPATAVPMGFDWNGLPLGVQVIARRGNDQLTIAGAGVIEEEFGGWVRANPTSSAS